MTIEAELATKLLNVCGISEESEPDEAHYVKSLVKTVVKRCGEVILPNPGESLALSVMRPKIAALAFDKVHRIPILEDSVPKELGFYCATLPELLACTFALTTAAAKDISGVDPLEQKIIEPSEMAKNERRSLRLLCADFQKHYGIVPTIIYENLSNRNAEFQSGRSEVLTAAISNVAVVNERDLSWEQVVEFRKDAEARIKYRRFVRWVDTELQSKSPKEVEDLIAIRLDDYQWSLKKHGLKTLIGNLSCLLDPKFLGGTSATIAATAVAGGGAWAALAGASLAIGKVALNFGTAAIDNLDQRREKNYEVAYVHEMKKKLG